jgi:hypothetical protein
MLYENISFNFSDLLIYGWALIGGVNFKFAQFLRKARSKDFMNDSICVAS